MENVIYNELRKQGYGVDVGSVESFKRDDHTVTIGLLDKALVALYQAFIVAVQLLVPLDGAEICGRKKGFQFLLCYEGLMMKRGTSDGIARNGGQTGDKLPAARGS